TWASIGRPTCSADGPQGVLGPSPAGALPGTFAAGASWNEGRATMRERNDADPAGGRSRRPATSAGGLAVVALGLRVHLLRVAPPFLLGALELSALLVRKRLGLLSDAALRRLARALVVTARGRAVSFTFVALRHIGS